MNAVVKPARYLSRRQVIQKRARYVQLELWNKRSELWSHDVPQSPIEVLQPGVGLKLAGFEIESRDFLGDEWDRGVRTEVAGLLDRDLAKVYISTRQSRVVQNFTAAHELGHALLHPHVDVKHRELPMDGPRGGSSWEEREADWFASEFLMPEKQVRREFASRFGEGVFRLTDSTAFALCGGPLEKVLLRCRSPRDLSKLLAETPTYNGAYFASMASRFSVSSKAMAIRIDELNLSA